MGRISVIFFFASLAFAQDTDRTFRLKNLTAARSVQEIATTLRSVARIEQLSSDTVAGTITVKDSADQLALAEWMVPKLDIVDRSGLGAQEYRLHNTRDEVVLVYELEHTTTTTGMQEMITSIRTVGDVQWIYMISAPKVLALRGEPRQMAFAKFLIEQMDQTPQPRSEATIHRFQLEGTRFDTAIVYGLARATDATSMQMMITSLRTVIDIMKIYQTSAPNLLSLRCSPGDLEVTEWLISELDRRTPKASGNEMRMPGGKDDVVHVFYLTHSTDSKAMMQMVTEIRSIARIQRMYVSKQPAAIILRGTADQVAMAGKMIASKDQPAQ